MASYCVRWLVQLLVLVSTVHGWRKKWPHQYYRTEPDFVASSFIIKNHTDDRSLLAPGYIFIAPYGGDHPWGPQIFDQDGELVWYGFNTTRVPYENTVLCFQVCDWLGTTGTHLCWSERDSDGGYNRVLSQRYERVRRDYRPVGGLNINSHEFNMLPGGKTFIQCAGRKVGMDLRPYKGTKDGAVADGCFQEIDVETHKVLFSWCYLDHFPPWETYLFLNVPENTVNMSSGISGQGVWGNPWDFMHENSIDKNEEGDYLVSARHLNQLIKVAGPNNPHGLEPGKPIWRLGGKSSDFQMDGDTLFSRQHHAKFIKTTATETIISVFNNAWEGINEATARTSSALFIKLDNVTMKATLSRMYAHPFEKLSASQGGIQVLPNGNVHVGWGRRADFSEFTSDGELLFHAVLSQGPTNYRTVKYPWEGHPRQPPKLLAYCRACSFDAFGGSPLIAYASWNGATLVHSWRFFVSASSVEGPWMPAGVFPRDGFETRADLTSRVLAIPKVKHFIPFVAVEALDVNGKVLANVTAETFVPRPLIRGRCSVDGCLKPKKQFRYNKEDSMAGRCSPSMVPYIIVLAFIVVGIESGMYFMQGVWERAADFGHRRYLYAYRRLHAKKLNDGKLG